MGAPIVEPPASPPAIAAAPVDAAVPAVPAEAAAPAVAPRAEGASRAQNSRADITLDAGDSGTLHVVARRAVAQAGDHCLCADEARIELKRNHEVRTVTGSGAVVLKLRPGARYQVRCAGDSPKAKARATAR